MQTLLDPTKDEEVINIFRDRGLIRFYTTDRLDNWLPSSFDAWFSTVTLRSPQTSSQMSCNWSEVKFFQFCKRTFQPTYGAKYVISRQKWPKIASMITETTNGLKSSNFSSIRPIQMTSISSTRLFLYLRQLLVDKQWIILIAINWM